MKRISRSGHFDKTDDDGRHMVRGPYWLASGETCAASTSGDRIPINVVLLAPGPAGENIIDFLPKLQKRIN
jgi:hypothetical protein